MDLKRIVIGVDASPESEVAVRHGLNIARHVGADIVLVHAGEIPPAARPAGRAADTYELLAREELAETRRMLEDLRERLSGQGVEVSHMVVPGFPDTGIAEAAIELGAALAVVGTHAATGLKRFLLGSVAESVVRASETDVLVARSGPGGAGRGGYGRILVATDFGPACERALTRALMLAADGADVELLHCWQAPIAMDGYAPARVTEPAVRDLRAAIVGAIAKEGKALADRNARPGVTLAFRSVESSPGSGILARAKEYQPDLIAVGSHGRHGLSRLLLGSVSEKIVRRAHCPVLVAHAH